MCDSGAKMTDFFAYKKREKTGGMRFHIYWKTQLIRQISANFRPPARWPLLVIKVTLKINPCANRAKYCGKEQWFHPFALLWTVCWIHHYECLSVVSCEHILFRKVRQGHLWGLHCTSIVKGRLKFWPNDPIQRGTLHRRQQSGKETFRQLDTPCSKRCAIIFLKKFRIRCSICRWNRST